ncbi:ABC transporter permease [Granulosicoccus antarcticus]|uniref:Inner membrane ABC transporter permease protein YnjC n=1 Tax=Granulosicoccus antarcticus IMCC3135 TaxID=1192854 RepID=A0A2Z2P4M1_9GAMM|nr:ABC transporter permease [Granulosicoccus antarcticus]ASJ76400.1 Inner membrane ABC transporter permease protein YnjC [Granulosicoccus antarcticus IMCC3135]
MSVAGQLLLRAMAWLLIGLFLLPVVLGLGGTLLPALGLAPTLAPGNGFAQILSDPRFVPALICSLSTGLISTFLVLGMTLLTLVCVHGTRWWTWLGAAMPPILAVPHAAIAIGLIFLLSPSGALVRLVSPELTGWLRPPTDWVVPDAGGWTLIIGLVIKETPFLLLAAAAQLPALNVDASLRIGRTLGYAPARCWSRLILPRLYPRIRLTLIIILAFNLTVVDMAVLLGPGNPPTLAVLLMSLVNDPGSRAAASAGAVLLAMLVVICFLGMWMLECLMAFIAKRRRQSGVRGHGITLFRRLGMSAMVLILLTSLSSLALLLVWSFTRRWRFPDAWPSQWTLTNWSSRADVLLQPAWTTLTIAVTTLLLALLSAIAWLELERRSLVPRLDGIWFVPLLIPQVSLLFGWQAVTLWAGIDGQWWTVVFTHWLYTLPYVILILAVPWRELAPEWGYAAQALGAGYWRVLWCIRLPMLRRPLCQASAVAIAVSVAQYLPTLLMGAGRHPTLATELVTSFGGVDRRMIAALAVLQSLLPLLAFVFALIYPRWRQLRVARQKNPSSNRAPVR